MELTGLTIHELQELLRRREVTAKQVLMAFLKRIAQVEGKTQAYMTVTGLEGLRVASRLDRRRQAGEDVGPLAGIPLAIKDVICTQDVPTTCSSKILDGFIPPYDATVMRRLDRAGMVLLGKTNMDEFAMGSSTENSGYKVTRNPWDLDRVPGGSSGGSAAAVTADLCAGALGSDTGGSIRQPAAFCGIVGLKPTYGRVSRYGLVAFASSLDQIGPMTKDVRDAAILLGVIAGHDACDSTSANVPVPDYTAHLGREVTGLRIGIPKEYFIEGTDPEVATAIHAAINLLESLGAKAESISLPHTEYAVATYYLVATAEASSNLARYDAVKYGFRAREAKDLLSMYMKSRQNGFGAEVKRRIMLGTYALSAGYYDAYYLKALKVRTLIRKDFEDAFKRCEVILTPTAPTPAFRLGEKTEDPLTMYLSDIFTISANLAGIPGVCLPCGFTQAGLPIGVQLLGKPFDEATLLQVAFAYEQATEWHRRKPPL
ncbi:MAG TPA: Asp-tRNA(Asn)/Glu-tRNA(Gln) amidotransferase subunit GatA [Candidatus Methylomirabilis sp.]|nr:Asp-tRNA(Asn)/Glu-tRNA(Gln) amidotransferase subunit GatA [Candidatus Methylomirabilis sp.]